MNSEQIVFSHSFRNNARVHAFFCLFPSILFCLQPASENAVDYIIAQHDFNTCLCTASDQFLQLKSNAAARTHTSTFKNVLVRKIPVKLPIATLFLKVPKLRSRSSSALHFGIANKYTANSHEKLKFKARRFVWLNHAQRRFAA